MNITAEDYQRALDGFLEDMSRLGDDVASVLLFGSMVKGNLRPGKSDILDAAVFLTDETFQDRARFLRALTVMVEACERLSGLGIYFHPFVYWNEHTPLPGTLFIHSEADSRFVYGRDIRERLAVPEASRTVIRTAFFHQRRLGFPLIAYLYKRTLTPQNCIDITYSLMQASKQLPMMICWALDLRPDGTMDAVVKMHEALQHVDLSVFGKIDELRRQNESGVSLDSEEVRAVLREALTLDDELNDLFLPRFIERPAS